MSLKTGRLLALCYAAALALWPVSYTHLRQKAEITKTLPPLQPPCFPL